MDTSQQDVSETFAYLDHNILDTMTKGDPKRIKELLKKIKLTPVYSNESLKEICRSKGYEQTFIDLLEEIGAKYIEPKIGCNWATIHCLSPKAQYDHFLQHYTDDPIEELGISDMLRKFYGGNPDTSFSEVFENPMEKVMQDLLSALDGLDTKDVPKEILPHIQAVRDVAPELPKAMKDKLASMTGELDNMSSSPVASFEEQTGIGPTILKNISPPHVVSQIWELVSSHMDASKFDLETFFGMNPQFYSADPVRELTPQEKVNAIYHQLNFLGYYRDSKMKKERRFRAYFSDMTHAGIAAYCHALICRDGDLVMKAKAAYEYLGIKTAIIFYPSEKQIGSAMLSQFNRYGPEKSVDE